LSSSSFNAEIWFLYINKETFISDIISIDARIDLAINPAELTKAVPGAGESPEKESMLQKIKMNMVMGGYMYITDLGKPFTAPDVSNAKETTVPAALDQETN